MNIFTQFFSKGIKNPEKLLRETETNLLRKEAKIGGTLFGDVMRGSKREFFCLDESTWVWFEQWTDNGEIKSKTTKYMVTDKGVVKSVNNAPYESITEKELRHLEKAAKLYAKKVKSELYSGVAA